MKEATYNLATTRQTNHILTQVYAKTDLLLRTLARTRTHTHRYTHTHTHTHAHAHAHTHTHTHTQLTVINFMLT